MKILKKHSQQFNFNISSDLFTTLSDGDTYPDCPKKRTVKSAERSEEFFEECVRLYKTSSSNSSLVASIEGGFSVWERKRLVDQALLHIDSIFGFFLDGFHRNGPEGKTIVF